MDHVQELGAFGLAAAMLVTLTWIIKNQATTINNHLKHLQRSIDKLPCRTEATCPEEETL